MLLTEQVCPDVAGLRVQIPDGSETLLDTLKRWTVTRAQKLVVLEPLREHVKTRHGPARFPSLRDDVTAFLGVTFLFDVDLKYEIYGAQGTVRLWTGLSTALNMCHKPRGEPRLGPFLPVCAPGLARRDARSHRASAGTARACAAVPAPVQP